MESDSEQALEEGQKGIERMRGKVNSDAAVLEDTITLAKELEEDRFRQLEPLISDNRRLRDEYLRVMQLSAYALREQAARDKLNEMEVEKEGYFKSIDSAINIEGAMPKADSLSILGISKAAYDAETESDPLLLLGRLRQAYQSNVSNIRRLWKNAMPVDYELLEKARDEDKQEMFKTVILHALNEVRKDSNLMRNGRISNRQHTGLVDLGEPWVKTIDYSIAMEMQGEALVDATNPIYRATDTRLEKVESTIREKKALLSKIEDTLNPKQKEETIIDERIRIKKLEEDTMDRRLQQKRSEYDELVKQMMSMPSPTQNPEEMPQ